MNFLPLSAKFLNASKLALAGDNSTTSPILATFLDISTASSKSLQWHIFTFFPFNAFTVAASIFSDVGPVNINVPTFLAIVSPTSL